VTDPHAGKITWPIEDHTVAKHRLLESYLGAWLPILATQSKGLNYFDGFAGPGEYTGGEDGSPVIALRTATQHKLKLDSEIYFLFIENDPARAAHLESLLATRFPGLPSGWKFHVETATFDRSISTLLDEFDKRGAKLAPTLVFVDPFGFTEFPMSTLQRILASRRCELFVTFMSGFISRFLEPDRRSALDALFGCSEWASAKSLSGRERIDFLVRLYERQLGAIPAKVFVRSFEICDTNDRPLYHLVFATKNIRGLEEMKEAMYRLDRTGAYRFSDYLGLSQKTLLDYADERSAHWATDAGLRMWRAFGGKSINELVAHKWTIESTPYIYRKKPILGALERAGAITEVKGRRKRGTYPDGCVVCFSPWPGDAEAATALGTGSKPGP
jgi:three-Cys-motif partner protein